MNVTIKLFENFIKENFESVLRVSPYNSTTPFPIVLPGEKEQLIFVAKCTPDLYEPLKDRDIRQKTPLKLTLYTEGQTVIMRFEIMDDIILESEIAPDMVVEFLTMLYYQKTITLAVMDYKTLNLVWFTNTIAFGEVRDQYELMWKRFGIV